MVEEGKSLYDGRMVASNLLLVLTAVPYQGLHLVVRALASHRLELPQGYAPWRHKECLLSVVVAVCSAVSSALLVQVARERCSVAKVGESI